MIALFEEITTEKALAAIEKDAALYDGMFVDMKDDKERKFVKTKASVITSLLKKLDRARIDKSANFKIQVEDEALKIKTRLQEANKPFTQLMDDYKDVRRVELEQEKQLQAAKDLAFQLPLDQVEAISMDKLFNFEKSELIREQKERDDLLTKEANERAIKAEQDKIDAAKQAKVDAANAEKQRLIDVDIAKETARLAEVQRQASENKAESDRLAKLEANKKHAGKVYGEIKVHLMESCGIDEKTAKSVVLALVKTNRITINY